MIFRRLSDWLIRLPSYRLASGEVLSGEPWLGLGAAVGITIVATLLRLVAEPFLPPGFPYVTYFPAVIITGFGFGLRAGTICATLSGLCAWYFFIPPVHSFDLGAPAIVALLFYAFVVAVDLGLIHLMMWAFAREARTHRELETLLEQQRLLEREVDHRVKNLFQTLSGLVSLSERNAETTGELAEALRSRIAAMGRSHSILRGALAGDRTTLKQVFDTALEPFDTGDSRIAFNGPAVVPGGSAMLSLSLIVNELATNAMKHGALKVPEGRVTLAWEVSSSDGMATITWTESGSPLKQVGDRQGFGSQLIPTLARGLGGEAHSDFAASGLVCTIRVATAHLVSGG
jgi:two-component sensor histidine kinase